MPRFTGKRSAPRRRNVTTRARCFFGVVVSIFCFFIAFNLRFHLELFTYQERQGWEPEISSRAANLDTRYNNVHHRVQAHHGEQVRRHLKPVEAFKSRTRQSSVALEGAEMRHGEHLKRQAQAEVMKVVKLDQRDLFMDAQQSSMQEIKQDPLRTSHFVRGKSLAFQPAVSYLGVLLDAGRHYFPVQWIKRLLDCLQDLNYNLLHLRLTDDQAFNLILISHPELAYPSAVNNPDKLVYSVDELKEITAYAKQRGISIMPEINVPGHAGAWAAGADDLVVPCPNFVCDQGYGVPLNVTHPALPNLLKDVLQEIIDIFDDPPFLHLGGDEVEMAKPCFDELGLDMPDYQEFELTLKQILQAIGYPQERVVRWEVRTLETELPGSLKNRTLPINLNLTGAMQHYWISHPGESKHRVAPENFFVSTWLYFDTNADETAYSVYLNTRQNFHLGSKLPTAIIAGTFELSTEFWYDRNVLGKLLAVAMGATNQRQHPQNQAEVQREFLEEWKANCESVGFGSAICGNNGVGIIPNKKFRIKWSLKWQIWKRDICHRLANSSDIRIFPKTRAKEERRAYQVGTDFFWDNFPLQKERLAVGPPSSIPKGWESTLGEHAVPKVGVILDVTSSMVLPQRLTEIVTNYIAKLGFNLIQLPLVTNRGFVYRGRAQTFLVQSLLSNKKSNPHYDLEEHIEPLIATAAALGIEMMPEIAVSTDAAGWFKAGFTANCPEHFCRGNGLANDINEDKLLPVLYSVIGELFKPFTSQYVHLGSDERKDASSCFEEAGEPGDFERFEAKLTTILRDMAGIGSSQILRWENRERTRYPQRTGNITHYRAGMTDIPNRPNETSPFFATVNILEGDAWSVFQRTRDVVQLQPTGILAEIRVLDNEQWATLDIPQRLIAFALGVSSSNSMKNDDESSSFQSVYGSLCQALGWSTEEDDCRPPPALKSPVSHVTDSAEFVTQHCNLLTSSSSIYKAKKPVEPFFDTGLLTKDE